MASAVENQDRPSSGPVNAAPSGASAALVLADGTVFYGHGAGASGVVVGELCFNTAMTGHQEILADPSYAGQIVCFTFPHVGNVGANAEDEEIGQRAGPQGRRGHGRARAHHRAGQLARRAGF